MRKTSFAVLLGIGIALLFQTSCKESNIETVENRDAEGRLERWQRNKKDFAKEGLYQRFYADGALAEEAHYVRDTLDGEHRFFYKTGTLESVEHYKMGVYHGKYLKYGENGKLLLEQEYADGTMQGFSLAYYPDGTLKEKVTIRDNEENGPFQEYHENGKLSAEGTYSPGEEVPLEQGELKEYDLNGTLIRIADCKDGVCQTRWKKEE